MTNADSHATGRSRIAILGMFTAVVTLAVLLLAPALDRAMTSSAVNVARDSWIGDAANWFHRVRPRSMLIFGGVAVVVFGIARPRRWRYLILVLTAAVVANRACWLLKLIVGRDRPWASGLESLHGIVDPLHSGTSFPSSHSTTVTAVSLQICLMTAGPRLTILGGIVGMGMGSLRVFAGAHYPSDVVAGWVLAATTILAVDILARRRRWAN